MNRTPLHRLIEAAEAVKGARVHQARDRLNPVAEMIECIRLVHRWRAFEPDRAAVVASLAEAWAADAIQ